MSKKPLTHAQVELLKRMPDDRFIFANDATAKVLVRSGLAISELKMKSVKFMNGTRLTDFHTAYKRTEKGRDVAKQIEQVTT